MHGYARRIAAELGEAEQVLEELKGVGAGRLRVAVVTTVNYFATRILARFCRDHPDVNVSLDVTNRESVIRLLEENGTDIVLMGAPPATMDLVSVPFMENPLVAIAPPGHGLVGRKRIPLARLCDEPFLIREPGSGTRAAMERFFDEHELTPRTRIEMSTNEAIKQSVEAGLGLGVVSLHTVELELAAGRLEVLDVQFFPIRRKWYVVHREGKRLSATAKAFIEYVLDHE
jgi:DNA-binding transcriptional LysR family regulator